MLVRPRLMFLLLAGLWFAGCLGPERIERKDETFKIITRPPGAQVWVGQPEVDPGQFVLAGESPVDVTRQVPVRYKTLNRVSWWWTGGFLAASAGGFVLGALSEGGSVAEGFGYGIGGLSAAVGLVMLIGCLHGELSEPKLEPVDTTFMVDIRMAGYHNSVHSILLPAEAGEHSFKLSPLPKPSTGPIRLVLAVLGLEDRTGSTLDEHQSRELSQILRNTLAGSGRYRVVPEDQIRSRLVDEKKKTHRLCYDQACQIELGRAVAADKLVQVVLVEVQAQCLLTVKVLDLTKVVAENAASIPCECTPSGILGAIEKIPKKL